MIKETVVGVTYEIEIDGEDGWYTYARPADKDRQAAVDFARQLPYRTRIVTVTRTALVGVGGNE